MLIRPLNPPDRNSHVLPALVKRRDGRESSCLLFLASRLAVERPATNARSPAFPPGQLYTDTPFRRKVVCFSISILFLNPKEIQRTTGKRHNFKTFPFQILSSPNSLFRDQLSLKSTHVQIKHYSHSWERKEANGSAIIIPKKNEIVRA